MLPVKVYFIFIYLSFRFSLFALFITRLKNKYQKNRLIGFYPLLFESLIYCQLTNLKYFKIPRLVAFQII